MAILLKYHSSKAQLGFGLPALVLGYVTFWLLGSWELVAVVAIVDILSLPVVAAAQWLGRK